MTNNNENGTKVETKVEPNVDAPGYFRHEALDAYAVARRATQFIAARRSALRGIPGEAGPQLERAIVGAQTNLASGAVHFGNEAKRHFRTALSEATEAGCAVDIVFDYGAFSEAEYTALRTILLRLCAMLRGLSR